jgi:tRNA dimethylallyltransferase
MTEGAKDQSGHGTLPRPPLVAVVGPTAAGKSELALRLCEEVSGEIVSADSRLLYRGMDIGTAKPTPEERMRVAHHLVDVADIGHPWSLATYLAQALREIEGVFSRHHLPILVGGTGQYVHALLEGWEIPPAAPDIQLRHELERRARLDGGLALHEELRRRDPEAAQSIDPRNVRRTIRALEVAQQTGEPFSRLRRRAPVSFRSLQIGLIRSRQELYARADQRITDMLARGWVQEVRDLMDRGYSPDLPPFSALGYGQIVQYLRGKMTMEECVTAIRRATRRLIRHQANWFRPDDPHIHWIWAGPSTLGEARRLVTCFLADMN